MQKHHSFLSTKGKLIDNNSLYIEMRLNMDVVISGKNVRESLIRVSDALFENADYLTSLDQKLGDGDIGITMTKIARTLKSYVTEQPFEDIGKSLVELGLVINRNAPSSIGTLLSTAILRAGKVVINKKEISTGDLAAMLDAANNGIKERGKSKLGDKTIIDALDPASKTFSELINEGVNLNDASMKALQSAEDGRDRVTGLESRVGRASWLGERTKGCIDPGAEVFVIILKSIIGI